MPKKALDVWLVGVAGAIFDVRRSNCVMRSLLVCNDDEMPEIESALVVIITRLCSTSCDHDLKDSERDYIREPVA